MSDNEITIVREGHVKLKVTAAPDRWESFPVREWSNGAIEYYNAEMPCQGPSQVRWVGVPTGAEVKWHD